MQKSLQLWATEVLACGKQSSLDYSAGDMKDKNIERNTDREGPVHEGLKKKKNLSGTGIWFMHVKLHKGSDFFPLMA